MEWRIARSVGIWALVVGGVFVVAVIGVAGIGAAGTADAPTDSQTQVPAGAEKTMQEANNTTNVTVDVVEAMKTAENETNGTAVGAELVRKGNVTELERPTRVYAVDLLLPNGTHLLADVNATDGSVRQVQTQESENGIFQGLFGDDEELPANQSQLDSIRSGIEAVELARNETGENRTVTNVELHSENDQLRYTVELISGEGIQSTVVVAADPDEGDVLTTDDEE